MSQNKISQNKMSQNKMSQTDKIRKLRNSLKPNEYINVDEIKVITELPLKYYYKGRLITQNPYVSIW